MADALRTPFKAKHPVNGRACEVCGDRASQWHHLLGQQHLRTFAAVEAKRRGMSPEEVRSLLRTLLRDERNLTALCWDCHQAVEARTIRLYLPQSAHDFASELGSEWLARVQQAYPPIERRAA